MHFKPIKAKKVYREIVDQIREMIQRGELKPGERLMAERDLAEQMQVGRPAVREAFRALEAMGIIEIRTGEGTFIRRADSQPFLENLALLLMTEKDTVKELLELRIIVEVESAGLAAVRHTAKDIKNMEVVLKQMETDLVAGELGDRADFQFHYAIAVGSGNTLLVKLLQTISETMQNGLQYARENLYRAPGTPRRLLQEHQAIYRAIKNGDVPGARQSMYEHLDRVEKALSK